MDVIKELFGFADFVGFSKLLNRLALWYIGEKESVYTFTTPDKLIADFRRDIARWNRENRYL
jgi:hypothetical protein